MPFPICARHAIELYRHMRDLVLEQAGSPDVTTLDQLRGQQAIGQHAEPGHCVYYIRVGDLIKVGTTRDLGKRLGGYPPGSTVLAVERGGHDLEARRLAQFAHLVVHRQEWLRPAPDLIEHINTIRQANRGVLPVPA